MPDSIPLELYIQGDARHQACGATQQPITETTLASGK